MGVFSKINRFREAGEEANVNNVERFGNPVRSLFTSTKVMTVHHRIEIVDTDSNIAYRAETKFTLASSLASRKRLILENTPIVSSPF